MEALALSVAHPKAAELAPEPTRVERGVGWLFAGTGLTLFAAMGLLGLAMRLTQADVIDVSASWFYRLMTLHGAGMLTGALLAMMGGLWFVLRPAVPLRAERALWSYGAILAGAVAVVVRCSSAASQPAGPSSRRFRSGRRGSGRPGPRRRSSAE